MPSVNRTSIEQFNYLCDLFRDHNQPTGPIVQENVPDGYQRVYVNTQPEDNFLGNDYANHTYLAKEEDILQVADDLPVQDNALAFHSWHFTDSIFPDSEDLNNKPRIKRAFSIVKGPESDSYNPPNDNKGKKFDPKKYQIALEHCEVIYPKNWEEYKFLQNLIYYPHTLFKTLPAKKMVFRFKNEKTLSCSFNNSTSAQNLHSPVFENSLEGIPKAILNDSRCNMILRNLVNYTFTEYLPKINPYYLAVSIALNQKEFMASFWQQFAENANDSYLQEVLSKKYRECLGHQWLPDRCKSRDDVRKLSSALVDQLAKQNPNVKKIVTRMEVNSKKKKKAYPYLLYSNITHINNYMGCNNYALKTKVVSRFPIPGKGFDILKAKFEQLGLAYKEKMENVVEKLCFWFLKSKELEDTEAITTSNITQQDTTDFYKNINISATMAGFTWPMQKEKPADFFQIAGEKHPKIRCSFGHGIISGLERTKNYASLVSDMTGGYEVGGCHWQHSAGFRKHYQTKEGKLNTNVIEIANGFNDHFDQNGEDAICVHVCHSEGAADTDLSLDLISEDRRKNIFIFAVGPSKFIDEKKCGDFIAIMSENDPVPKFVDSAGLAKALKAGKVNIVKEDEKIKSNLAKGLMYHAFSNPKVLVELEELLADFYQKN